MPNTQKLKKFVVEYEQTNTIMLDIEAIDKDEAREKAEIELFGNKKTKQDLLDMSQVGYWEHCYTEEVLDNDEK